VRRNSVWSPEVDTLTHLLLEARDGDRFAFERALQLASADVVRLVRSLADDDDVDDVVQNTFVGAWRSLSTYRAEAPGRAWLLAIARRACIDAVRARQRLRRLHATYVDLRPSVVVTDSSHAYELRELVRSLPCDARDAFVLTQLLGLPYAEAAAVCAVPIGTIRSRVARARSWLVARDAAAANEAAGQ
jgi:RNA polymerase sigma-70 factor (ECF subfamily)